MSKRPYIVGNWKMNGTRATLSEARAIDRAAQRIMKVEVALAPPYTLIHAVHREVQQIGVGAQDCHHLPDGAHTGDISATMVADSGAKFVILGHSERRQDHGETNALIRAKMKAALAAGLRVILCCGESQSVREAGGAIEFVTAQIRESLCDIEQPDEFLTIAYEPIWAIGTGKVASGDDIVEMHRAIRALLDERFDKEQSAGIRILYGGSVKPENAREILTLPGVDGALVGGASLVADSFMGIAIVAGETIED